MNFKCTCGWKGRDPEHEIHAAPGHDEWIVYVCPRCYADVVWVPEELDERDADQV